MGALLWLEFAVFLTFLSTTSSLALSSEDTCYKFAKTNVGSISPNHFDKSIAVGSSLELRCSLDARFARERSLTSSHITWQKDYLDVVADDARITITPVDGQTSVIKVDNVGVGDSGGYRCMVPMNATKQFICSVTARIAEPPKKYVNFTCVSNLMEDLICSWKRPDVPAPNSAQVNYTMKYHYPHNTVKEAILCPEPLPPGRKNGQNRDMYGCTIRFRSKEDREAEAKKKNGTVAAPYMSEYVHYITITASNDLFSESWNETVDPKNFTNPGPPSRLSTSTMDANTCHLEWIMTMSITTDHKGFDFEIDYRKNDSEPEMPWTQDLHAYDNMKGQSPYEDAHIYKGGVFWYDVTNLDAYSNYTLRVRGFPTGAANGHWGNYSYARCSTPTAVPSGKPGVAPGAYEELSEGMKREVDVYWKGVPKDRQNGPHFLYRIHGLGDHGEMKWTAKTEYNNYRILAPFNETVRIKIIPLNNMSMQDVSDYSEIATIPPVRSTPLRVTHTNMEILKDSTYEIYWETNESADEFQIFYCPTSLDPHMGKCTNEMSMVSVRDRNVRSYLLKLDEQHKYYRFAVAANRKNPDGSVEYSGMNWVRYLCREEDSKYGLDGLMVDQLANASVNINWVVPCHRFMHAAGFRINYSPCPPENRSACLQNEVMDVPFNTSTTGPACLRSTVLPTLQPDTRYCFSVSITSSTNETNTGYSIYQCMVTAPLPAPLPIVRIVVGSVVAALALVVICLLLSRAFKRMRRTFKDIQKESKNIVLPTKPAFPGNYNGTHYTMIEGDDTGRYLRQQSEGIGSLAPEDMGKITPAFGLLPEFGQGDFKPLKTGRFIGSTPLVARMSKSLLDLENALSTKRSGSVPGIAHLAVSRQSLAARRRPLGSSEVISLVLPRSGSLGTELTGLNSLASSGGESDAPASSGYVAAGSSSQANQSTASSREQTGDMGYVSQPASNYDSSAERGSVLAGTTSGSSGFSEMSNSPDHGSGVRPDKMWEKPHHTTGRRSTEEVDSPGERGGVTSPLLPKEGTTMPVSSSDRISKAPIAQPVANGYVAWP